MSMILSVDGLKIHDREESLGGIRPSALCLTEPESFDRGLFFNQGGGQKGDQAH